MNEWHLLFFPCNQNEQHMEESCQTEVGDEMPIKPGIGISYEVLKNIKFVNRIIELVSFELGKEIEKDAFFCLVTSMGQKKIQSSHEELNPRPLGFHTLMLYH